MLYDIFTINSNMYATLLYLFNINILIASKFYFKSL